MFYPIGSKRLILSVDNILKQKLDNRLKNDQLRVLKCSQGLEDFSSNDYLGLSRNKELASQIELEYKSLETSLGSGGSRLLAGNSSYFEELETELAKVHFGESALLMNSGFVANLAVFSTLPQKGDTVIYDELIHTCIKDGVRLSNAAYYSFKHNDVASLEQKLKRATGTVFVAVESVYSMDGDTAPLVDIIKVCKQYNAQLIVDEAHSTGVFGKGGAGLCCALGIEKDIAVRVHTFGKAMGCHGAVVIASEIVKQYLVNFSRPFIYTTAMPLHGLVTIKNAYRYLHINEGVQQDLKRKIELFKSNCVSSVESDSAIQVVIIPGNTNVKRKAEELQKAGFDVRPVMSPTVKEGAERLRICLHVHNSDQSIIQLAKLLK